MSEVKVCTHCGSICTDKMARFCPKCGSALRAQIEFYDAFVSYRREGGSELAELVRISLQAQYGMNLFVDVNELRAGAFDEKLLAIIENAPCFLLILSKGSLDRCQNEGDWLRREIAHALKQGKRIVPVLAKGFVMPPAESLPEDIRKLTSMNGVPYDHQFREAAISKIGGFIRDGQKPAPLPTVLPTKSRRGVRWILASVAAAGVVLAGASYYWGVYAPKQRVEQQRVAEEAQKQKAEQERLSAEAQGRQESERRESDRRAAARGGLIVRTTPSGAEVRVGVIALEKSPLTLKEQKLGKYPVQIRLEGYEQWDGEVELKENEFTDLDIVLQRSTGALTLTSEPAGLAVEVKGESVEPRMLKTPTKVELATGEYSVTFRREGWAEQTQTVAVKRKTVTTATAEFVPGSLSVTSEPAGCTYILTGPEGLSRTGKTPKTEEQLPTGDYSVTLSATGYKEAACKVAVKRMSTAVASLILEQESAENLFKKAMSYWSGTGVPKDEAQAASLLRQAADRGHAGSQNQLGNACKNGNGVAKDTAQAVAWYQKAADQGEAAAQYNLGVMYGNGQGLTKDSVQAVAWYQKAADQGYALAQYNLGCMYAKGEGVGKDPIQAVAWYRKAADQGDAAGQRNLGFMYANGLGVIKDPVQAFVWCKKAADQGDAIAQSNLAVMYANGEGVAKDPVQAVAWYRKAAEQDLALGQNGLGYMYANGLGVATSPVQAVVWYQKAANQGDALAQCNLGYMYENGRGVAKDLVQAIAWYQKAADQGNADAQRNLGYMYANGQGVATDFVQAVAWYRKAADQDLALGQFALGNMYTSGQGVPKDPVQAVVWFRKAADQGYALAQYNLGVMYENGKGVPKDRVQAGAWYKKAASQGNENAIKALKRM